MFKTLTPAFKTFSLLTVLVLGMAMPMFWLDKAAFSLFLNHWHSLIGDVFMKNITYLGTGTVYIPIFLYLLQKNKKLSLVFVISVVVQFLLVSVLMKRYLFADMLRPIAMIPDFDTLNLVEGVKLHRLHSFPSGHSQTAFLVASFLAYTLKNRIYGVLIFLVAALIAISRVYLFQHFFMDIWVGSLIGFGLSWVALWLQKYWVGGVRY